MRGRDTCVYAEMNHLGTDGAKSSYEGAQPMVVVVKTKLAPKRRSRKARSIVHTDLVAQRVCRASHVAPASHLWRCRIICTQARPQSHVCRWRICGRHLFREDCAAASAEAEDGMFASRNPSISRRTSASSVSDGVSRTGYGLDLDLTLSASQKDLPQDSALSHPAEPCPSVIWPASKDRCPLLHRVEIHQTNSMSSNDSGVIRLGAKRSDRLRAAPHYTRQMTTHDAFLGKRKCVPKTAASIDPVGNPLPTRRFVCKTKLVFAASHKTKLVFADYEK